MAAPRSAREKCRTERAMMEKRPRLWEIDTLRGLAVVAMIFFHLMWDLWFLGLTSQNIPGPGWQGFARGIGASFTFLLGLSVVLSAASLRRKQIDPWPVTFKRGLMVFGCGLIISLGTWFFVGNEFVRFGILHHAGVAIIVSYLLMRLPVAVLAPLGAAIIALGTVLNGLTAPGPWLIPLGVAQSGVGMVDYYPILPWTGVALLGVCAGKLWYAEGVRRFALPDLSARPAVRALSWLGRNSLLVYLTHQLILLGLLMGAQAVGLL
jgi:uncharacterized membrane protein